jgi:glucosamine kinase
VEDTILLLGVDGGGTRCRARLATPAGDVLGEGAGGPANIRFGLAESFGAVLAAAGECLQAAGLPPSAFGRTVACLALAGASEPADEGSGAWLGSEAVRRILWAHDGRIAWTPLLAELFADFRADPHALVRFAAEARPRDFARLAPAIVAQARRGDAVACELMRLAAGHIDGLAQRLVACGARRLCLMGGLAEPIAAWLAEATRQRLTEPRGDALSGALALARAEAADLRLVA